MECQPDASQTLSFCSRTRVKTFGALFLVVMASPFCISQVHKGDAGVGAVAPSSTAILGGSKLPEFSVLPSDRPLANETASTLAALSVAVPSPQPALIVVGFAGGFVRRTSSVHGEVELAVRLRERYGRTIHAEIFENHHGDDACQEILRLVDASNRAVPATTRKAPRIILYGHSWGGSEAVNVARELERHGVPVLLVVQVDSVAKRGQDDSVIPANVAQAINFYQSDGLLHGRRMVRAANPVSTKIIGNFRYTYKDGGIPCPGYPWYTRLFTKPHIEIENDPRVWDKVEALILSNVTQ
jgi:hypothetical protein